MSDFERYTGGESDIIPLEKYSGAADDIIPVAAQPAASQPAPAADAYPDQVSRAASRPQPAAPDAMDTMAVGSQRPAPQSIGQSLKQTGKDLLNPIADVEAATNAATGFLFGFPGYMGGAVGGLADAVGHKIAGDDVDISKTMKERAEAVAQAFTYQPKTEAGQRLAAGLSAPLSAIAYGTGTEGLGGSVTSGARAIGIPDTAAAVLGAAVGATTEMAANILLFHGVKEALPAAEVKPNVTPSAADERAFGEKLKSTLLDPEAPQEQRAAAAAAVAARISDVSPAHGEVFLDNALEQIKAGRPVNLGPDSASRMRENTAEGPIEGQFTREQDVVPQLEAPAERPTFPAAREDSGAPALPRPGDVAIRADEARAPTEVPVVDPAQAHADSVYAARDAVEKARTASAIEVDPANPKASIAAIASAPLTEVAPALKAPVSVDPQLHAAKAGDVAGIMLSIAQLNRDLKVTPPAGRAAVKAHIESLQNEARQSIADYSAQYGADAGSHMHSVAAETFHNLKGDYRSLQRPTAPAAAVQETGTPAKSEQAPVSANAETAQAAETNAVQMKSTPESDAAWKEAYPDNPQAFIHHAGEKGPDGAWYPRGRSPKAAPEVVPISGTIQPKTGTVDVAAHEAATSPTNDLAATREQILAGNYKKGHFTFTANGMGVTIENPHGSIREDKHNFPPQWRQRMDGVHYGYLKLTDAADSKPGSSNSPILQKGKQGLDVMVQNGIKEDYNGPVFVVDQKTKGGKFDEHKIVIGPKTEAEARALYQKQYAKGWDGIQSISQTTMDGLKQWARFGDTKAPYADKVLTGENDKVNLTGGQPVAPGAVKTVPNPMSASTKRGSKTSVGVSDIREAAHVVLGKIDGSFIDEKIDYSGVRKLTPKEDGKIAAVIRDLIDAGLPANALHGVDSTHVYTPTSLGESAHHSITPYMDSSIGIADHVMDAVLSGHQGWNNALLPVFAHEVWHNLATTKRQQGQKGWRQADAESPRFEVGFENGKRTAVGPVMKEALAAYNGGGDLGEMLGYPFRSFQLSAGDKATDGMLSEEVAAQLFSIYYSHPAAMKRVMPEAYQTFKELNDVIKSTPTVAGAANALRDAIHSHLQSAGTGVGKGRILSADAASGDRSGNPVAEANSTRRHQAGDAGERSGNEQDQRATDVVREQPERARSTSTAVNYRNTRGHILGDNVTVADVARHFEGVIEKEFGGPLSIEDPVAVKRAYDAAKEEVKYQITQARNGLDWYEEDIGLAHKLAARYVPELKSGTKVGSPLGKVTATNHRLMLGIVAGMHSPQNPAAQNWEQAVRNYKNFVASGKLDGMNPDTGKRWAANVNPQPFTFLNKLIDAWGFNKTLEYLLTPHTVKELNELKHDPKWGVYKDAPVEGKLGDIKLGVHLFGPKVGPFSLGLNGINTEVAVDVWATRTMGRWFGHMLDHGGVIDAPTEAQRKVFQKIATDVAKEMGYNPNQIQAVLWFFEQQLYTKMGVRTDTPKFSDGAVNLLRKEGIEHADLTGPAEDRAARINAVHANDEARQLAPEAAAEEPSGAAVYDDFREDPESALKKPGWAILNGNLNGKNEAANAKSNDRLESELTHKGIDFKEVDGFWQGQPEGRSFLIFAPAKTALAIGKRYGQKAITTNKGFEYVDGKVDAADHANTVVGPDALKRDGYSVLPDGTAFSLGFPAEPNKTAASGDGRGFTDFFTAASKGERAPDVKTYEPVLDISSAKDFSAEYVKHRGNFDDHIATSIPGFREVQQAVGSAIVKSYPVPGKRTGATLLDIAASEGAFNKAITATSDGAISTLALDPNEQMAKFFDEHSQVSGADYDMSAFGPKEDEGKVAWKEPSGTVIKTFKPIEQYDIVHEAMGFQFIDGDRASQFARVKELMRPDGIALFEEKVKEDTPSWHANEAQKDAYKAQYYTKSQMKAKAAEVLTKGGDSVVGMNDLMKTPAELESALTSNWKYVSQYWDSGNFKGYVASDSLPALNRFIGNLPDLNSEFSTVDTPREVSEPDAETKVNRLMEGNPEAKVRVDAVEEETGRKVSVEMPAREALDHLSSDIVKAKRLLECLSY